MDNKFVLKGIQFVTSAQTTFDSDILYFVRTRDDKKDGYIHFNNKNYGAGEDLKDILGSLPTGYDTWEAYVAAVSAQTTANTENLAAVSAQTTANTENLASVSAQTTANTENLASVSAQTTANTENLAAVSAQTTANTESINTLNGDASTDGSVAKKIADAIDALAGETGATDGYVGVSASTENGEIKTVTVSVSSQTVADASETAKGLAEASDVKSYVDSQVSAMTVDATGDTLVNATASGKTVTVSATDDLKNAVTSASTAVQSVNSKTGTAITLAGSEIELGSAITSGDTTVQASTAKVTDTLSDLYTKEAKNADDIAKLSGVTISDVKYDETTHYIYLVDNNNSATTGFDASKFIVDGMLSNAELVDNDGSGNTGQYIKLTWNTDAESKVMYVNVTDLVDTYTADETTLTVSGNTFSAKTDVNGGVASYSALTSVSAQTTANTENLAAVSAQTTANTENLAAVSAQTTANTESINTLNGDASTDGSVAKKIADAIDALAGETGATDGYIGVSASTENGEIKTVTVSMSSQTVADASETAKGIAEASDVKSYVDAQVSAMTVDATGDTLVTATASGKTVTVAATDDLKNAVTSASTAVQSINDITGTAVTLTSSSITVGEDIIYGEGTTAVTIATSAETVNDAINGVLDEMVANEETTSEALNNLDTRVSAITESAVQSVNGVTGTSVTIDATDIEIGSAITSGDTTIQESTAKISATLADIYAKIASAKPKLETATEDTVNAGHLEIKENENGELYGVMYYGGSDAQTTA